MTTESMTWENLDVPESEPLGLIRALIEGRTPLLMNNPAGTMNFDAAASVERKSADATMTPQQDAESGLYIWPDGELYVPGIAVYSAVKQAATKVKLPKVKDLARGSGKAVTAGIKPLKDGFALIDENGEAITDWETDVQRVVIQKAAIVRGRARIPAGWRLVVEFEWDPLVVGEALVVAVKESLVDAGRRIGLLDYRPERGGTFGRFDVLNFEYMS